MKFFKGTIVLVLLLISAISARQPDFSIFGQLGFGLVASKGDFNDRVLAVKDQDGKDGNLHPATLQILGTPDMALGVNIKNISLALDFQYWTSEQNLTGHPDVELERESRILRLGPEITYNVFWPEFFQAGLGGGISYISVKTSDNLFYSSKTYDTDFSGIGIAFIANMHYYVTDHVVMVPALKYYENIFFGVDADRLKSDSLKDNLWQTMVLVSLTVQYQF